MLVCGPSNSGKTNLLLDMIYRLLFFDKIYLYGKNLHQSKYKHLFNTFNPISKDVGYPVIEASNDKILPLDEGQKLIIFDDYLNTGSRNDSEIRNYFTNSRNKNCSCVYLSQSFYGTDKTIRLNCSHYCIFEFPSTHDNFNTDKVCNSANPTQVGFVHIYEPCILVTFNAFYVTSHWESQLGTYFQNRFLRSKH